MTDNLKKVLLDEPSNRKRLLGDCVNLIDREVAAKKGFEWLGHQGRLQTCSGG